MSQGPIKNLAASVKQRLINYAQTNGLDFNAILSRFGMERLLYRLSKSSYNRDFYLKGAILFVLWEKNPNRPTKDLDLLFIPHHDQNELMRIFKEVCSTVVSDDGLFFDPESVTVEEIREANAYGGLRVKLVAYLGTGRVPLQVDVGLGDSVYPETDWTEFPPLLEFSAPRIRAYPTETVIAEKFQATVDLELRNTRMKDYYDIHYLSRKFSYSGKDLFEAIAQTFSRRKTAIPGSLPIGLSKDFSESPQRQIQWNAFLRKNGLDQSTQLPIIVSRIADFLMPVILDKKTGDMQWTPEGGWSDRKGV
jgi:predicted nucleotidyltransferase component of viral defense system